MKRNRLTAEMKTMFREDIAKLCLKRGLTTSELVHRLPKRWHRHYANAGSLANAILYHSRVCDNLTLTGNGVKLIFKADEYDGPDETVSPNNKNPDFVKEEPEQVEDSVLNIDRSFLEKEIENLYQIQMNCESEVERLRMESKVALAKRMSYTKMLQATDELIGLGAFQIN